jgi:hypothetical protein
MNLKKLKKLNITFLIIMVICVFGIMFNENPTIEIFIITFQFVIFLIQIICNFVILRKILNKN